MQIFSTMNALLPPRARKFGCETPVFERKVLTSVYNQLMLRNRLLQIILATNRLIL